MESSKKEKQRPPSARVYKYLELYGNGAPEEKRSFLQDLEKFLINVLKGPKDDFLLQNLLNFGWNERLLKFNDEDVDIVGLRIALSKKSQQFLFRASNIGNTATTKSFVPEILLDHLLRISGNEDIQIKPSEFFLFGVCVVIDISGFTRMSGAFCAQGKDGIDGLQLATNGFMGKLVEIVYSHGGDIIKFAGDAIICLFISDDVELFDQPYNIRSKRESPASIIQQPIPSKDFQEKQVCDPLLIAEVARHVKESSERLDHVRTSVSTENGHAMVVPGVTNNSSSFATANAYEGTENGAPERHFPVKLTPIRTNPSFLSTNSEPSSFMNLQTAHTSTTISSLTTATGITGTTFHPSEKFSSVSDRIDITNHSPLAGEAVLRALLCAAEAKEACTETLTVHVGVSCGEVCFGILGGYEDRWECLISGKCLEDMSQCLDEAEPKEAVITPASYGILQHSFRWHHQDHLSDGSSPSSLHPAVEEKNSDKKISQQLISTFDLMISILPSGDARLQKINAPVIENIVCEIAYRNNGSTSGRHGSFMRRRSMSTDTNNGHNMGYIQTIGAAIPIRKSVDEYSPEKVDSELKACTSNKVPNFQPNFNESYDCLESSYGSANSLMLESSGRYEDPQLVAKIAQFVPFPVVAGLQYHGDLRYLGEIREVTTMFMKWDSFSSDTHGNLLALQDGFVTAQKILSDNGAFLRQFLVDDKGCVLIACWGVPSASYWDNAHRALCSAAQIRSALLNMSSSMTNDGYRASNAIRTSYGITTGNVYCGTVGNEMRAEYVAMGDVVNMAARLMCKADGGILTDEATYFRLPHSTLNSMHELPPMKVKGKSILLAVYAYVAASEITLKLTQGCIEDYEIRSECKTVLLQRVEDLTIAAYYFRSSVTPTKGRPQAARRILSLISVDSIHEEYVSAETPTSHSRTSRFGSGNFISSMFVSKRTLKCVLIEGRSGSGKGNTVKWLKNICRTKEVHLVSAALVPKDGILEFRLLEKLFKQLLHIDYDLGALQNDNMQQQQEEQHAVFHLLRKLYGTGSSYEPGNQRIIQRNRNTENEIRSEPRRTQSGVDITFATIIHALGISFVAPQDANRTDQYSDQLPPKPTQAQMYMSIFEIFAYMLNRGELPVMLLIENIHLADEESLKVISKLFVMRTQTSLIMTSLPPEDIPRTKKPTLTHLQIDGSPMVNLDRKTNGIVPNGSSDPHQRIDPTNSDDSEVRKEDECLSDEWIGRYRTFFLEQTDATTLITLENYTQDEIRNMLIIAFANNTTVYGSIDYNDRHHGNVIAALSEERSSKLAQMVLQLTGGDAFWVREMIEYLVQMVDSVDSLLEVLTGDEIGEKRNGKAADVVSSDRDAKVALPPDTVAAAYTGSRVASARGEICADIKGALSDNSTDISGEYRSPDGKCEKDVKGDADVEKVALKRGLFSSFYGSSVNNGKSSANFMDGIANSATSTPKSVKSKSIVGFLRIFSSKKKSAMEPDPPRSPEKTNDRDSMRSSQYLESKTQHLERVQEPALVRLSRAGLQNHSRSRLEQFVVCRFELLASGEQKLLRTACIIGNTFSRHILYGVLPQYLKGSMYMHLRSLLKQKWITQDLSLIEGNYMVSSKEMGSLKNAASILPAAYTSRDDSADYTFYHPLMSSTLYELTPLSDRAKIHKRIALYVEEMNPDNPDNFPFLLHHYFFCNKRKACEYAVKAAARFTSSAVGIDIHDFLMLYERALTLCESLVDVEVMAYVLEKANAKYYGRGDFDDLTEIKPMRSSVGQKDTQSLKRNKRGSWTRKFLFCSSSLSAVAPINRMDRSNSSRRFNPELCGSNDACDTGSVRSKGGDSAKSALTTKALAFMTKKLLYVDSQLEVLHDKYIEEENFGEVEEWQIPFLPQVQHPKIRTKVLNMLQSLMESSSSEMGGTSHYSTFSRLTGSGSGRPTNKSVIKGRSVGSTGAALLTSPKSGYSQGGSGRPHHLSIAEEDSYAMST